MKDPKVTELVKRLNKDIIALNNTWAALHKEGVHVRMEIVGDSTYATLKSLNAREITQHVAYTKEDTLPALPADAIARSAKDLRAILKTNFKQTPKGKIP